MKGIAIWEEAGLTKLVEGVNQKLNHKYPHEDSGDLEEEAEIDPVAVAGPKEGDPGSCEDTQDSTGDKGQGRDLKGDADEHQSGFHPFPGDHQEGEKEDAPVGHSAVDMGGRRFQVRLDVFLHGAGGPPHVDDQGPDQHGGRRGQHALPEGLVDPGPERDARAKAQKQ